MAGAVHQRNELEAECFWTRAIVPKAWLKLEHAPEAHTAWAVGEPAELEAGQRYNVQGKVVYLMRLALEGHRRTERHTHAKFRKCGFA